MENKKKRSEGPTESPVNKLTGCIANAIKPVNIQGNDFVNTLRKTQFFAVLFVPQPSTVGTFLFPKKKFGDS